jgi:hypothetical protein
MTTLCMDSFPKKAVELPVVLDWFAALARKAKDLQHGELTIHFVAGKAKRIVRTESELI